MVEIPVALFLIALVGFSFKEIHKNDEKKEEDKGNGKS